jgi:hypothetical protein
LIGELQVTLEKLRPELESQTKIAQIQAEEIR